MALITDWWQEFQPLFHQNFFDNQVLKLIEISFNLIED
jgi:hypothetical protein